MAGFLVTLAITFVIVLIALLFLGIGWLLSGKARIVRGDCGMNPEQRRKASCDGKIQCDLCNRTVDTEDVCDEE